jgi:UDP-glucose 4-epimerase
VRVLDDFSTGKRENIESLPIELLEGDVRDAGRVRTAVQGMDHVFHLAALASVGRSLRDPLTTHSVNETGTLTVLEASRKAGVRRVVYAASSSAYGNSQAMPKREDAKPAPASPYAVSKLTGEHYCHVYWEAFGLETACVRYFNVFGPRQDPKSEYAAVIPRFIDAALRGGTPVIYGDGTQSRDFTYVANAVEATIAAATAPKAAGEVINVACGERRSLLELVEMLEDFLGDSLQPVFEATRPGDVKHSQAGIEKARELLAYTPQIGFKEGLKETVDWYRKQLALGRYEERIGGYKKDRDLATHPEP